MRPTTTGSEKAFRLGEPVIAEEPGGNINAGESEEKGVEKERIVMAEKTKGGGKEIQ